jgi:histidine triad (HIT) family protein
MEQMNIFSTNDKCTFCKIVRSEIKSYITFEDEISFAFLDHRPLLPGHILFVPKNHYETLIELPSDIVAPFFANVQLLAEAVEVGSDADGSFVAINTRISQSVPHLHVHIVPRWKKDGLFSTKNYIWQRRPYKDEDEIIKVQNSIRSTITQIQNKYTKV